MYRTMDCARTTWIISNFSLWKKLQNYAHTSALSQAFVRKRDVDERFHLGLWQSHSTLFYWWHSVSIFIVSIQIFARVLMSTQYLILYIVSTKCYCIILSLDIHEKMKNNPGRWWRKSWGENLTQEYSYHILCMLCISQRMTSRLFHYKW